MHNNTAHEGPEVPEDDVEFAIFGDSTSPTRTDIDAVLREEKPLPLNPSVPPPQYRKNGMEVCYFDRRYKIVHRPAAKLWVLEPLGQPFYGILTFEFVNPAHLSAEPKDPPTFREVESMIQRLKNVGDMGILSLDERASETRVLKGFKWHVLRVMNGYQFSDGRPVPETYTAAELRRMKRSS
jgi:hypothetical protein